MVGDQYIEFRFGNADHLEVETEGFKGAACEAAMDRAIKGLGEKISARYTEDYYEPPDGTQNTQEGSNG